MLIEIEYTRRKPKPWSEYTRAQKFVAGIAVLFLFYGWPILAWIMGVNG